jgi:hypothetical protein
LRLRDKGERQIEKISFCPRKTIESKMRPYETIYAKDSQKSCEISNNLTFPKFPPFLKGCGNNIRKVLQLSSYCKINLVLFENLREFPGNYQFKTINAEKKE